MMQPEANVSSLIIAITTSLHRCKSALKVTSQARPLTLTTQRLNCALLKQAWCYKRLLSGSHPIHLPSMSFLIVHEEKLRNIMSPICKKCSHYCRVKNWQWLTYCTEFVLYLSLAYLLWFDDSPLADWILPNQVNPTAPGVGVRQMPCVDWVHCFSWHTLFKSQV